MAKKKKELNKANNRELSNGAFILIIVFCVLIAGIIGWILGNCAYTLGL